MLALFYPRNGLLSFGGGYKDKEHVFRIIGEFNRVWKCSESNYSAQGGGDVLRRMRRTHKMATNTSGNAGRALSFAIDSLAEFICSKGSSSIGYRVDWCINHRLQSNQFVGRRDEKEEKVRWRIGVSAPSLLPTLIICNLDNAYH